MTSTARPRRQHLRRIGRHRIAPSRLDGMIEEAIVDAYTESEQIVGFHTTIEQRLQLPFETVILGVAVTVKKVDVAGAGEIVAVCHRGGERQAIPILDLPLPDPPPEARPAAWRHAREQAKSLVGRQSRSLLGDYARKARVD